MAGRELNWLLVIVFSGGVSMQTIPFESQELCTHAAWDLAATYQKNEKKCFGRPPLPEPFGVFCFQVKGKKK